MTPYHAKLWATMLRLRGSEHSADRLGHSLAGARVDLNPHQVSAAVFAMQALRLGGPRGALLADEVGLGKTIEAGLLLAQYWAEGRRNLLLVVPAMLRKQWQAELAEKFGLAAQVVDAAALRQLQAAQVVGQALRPAERIWIVSYHFAARVPHALATVAWDLAVLDEAHRMRNGNRGGLMAVAITQLLQKTPRILLTATPLQNNLLELHSLGQLLDPHLFGDVASFKERFVKNGSEHVRNALLRERLQGVCVRTLRRQVQEYVQFTRRAAYTQRFVPTQEEHALYEDVSEWLRREDSVALPAGQRQLLTMVLRKLLASSTMAIAGALRRMIARVEEETGLGAAQDESDLVPLLDDFEAGSDVQEALRDPAAASGGVPSNAIVAVADAQQQRAAARAELLLLRELADRAERIARNTKADALLLALEHALQRAAALGGAGKAVVFTESRRTQAYPRGVLQEADYKVVCISGQAADAASKAIYQDWLRRHAHDGTISGVRNADMRAALVEHFRDEAQVLLATEAASEGVNLQFCSLVVNYDLPWNPQRVEQRIGRCHRYGQKHDVVVVNFLNERNEADRRVLELLTDKFLLFEGVFGCSDEVLGAVGNGVDLERSIADIYQRCRAPEEIAAEFDALQERLRPLIDHQLAATREQILGNFDDEVQARLRVHRDEVKQALDKRQGWLLDLLRHELSLPGSPASTFSAHEASLAVAQGPFEGRYHLDWRRAEALGVQHLSEDHPLATSFLDAALGRPLPEGLLQLQLPTRGRQARWEPLVGQSGQWAAVLLSAAGLGDEESLVTVCCTDDGTLLDAETADRLWALPAQWSAGAPTDEAFAQTVAAACAAPAAALRARRAELLEQESEKLSRWADDEKLALQLRLSALDSEIAEIQRKVRQVTTLEDKLALRKEERDLDRKRLELRRSLFDAQDRIDAERNRLLDALADVVQGEVQQRIVMQGRWVLGGRR